MLINWQLHITHIATSHLRRSSCKVGGTPTVLWLEDGDGYTDPLCGLKPKGNGIYITPTLHP